MSTHIQRFEQAQFYYMYIKVGYEGSTLHGLVSMEYEFSRFIKYGCPPAGWYGDVRIHDVPRGWGCEDAGQRGSVQLNGQHGSFPTTNEQCFCYFWNCRKVRGYSIGLFPFCLLSFCLLPVYLLPFRLNAIFFTPIWYTLVLSPCFNSAHC